MRHVTFARFHDAARAVRAIDNITHEVAGPVRILVHGGARGPAEFEQQIQGSGDLAESDVRHALVVGGTLRLFCGAVLGAVLALLGVFPSTILHGVFVGALMGMLVGLLMMVLVGSGLLDRRLKKLARGLHAGEVVITVDAEDEASTAAVAKVLREASVETAEKSLV
jgi:hypothetical protein